MAKKIPEYMKHVTQDEFAAFTGKNFSKLELIRQRILTGDKSTKGEKSPWQAFILMPIYQAYYKMWEIVIPWLVIVYSGYYLLGDKFPSVGVLVVTIVMGARFNRMYVDHACRKIVKMKRYETDPERLKLRLEKAGRPSWLWVAGTIAVMFACGLGLAELEAHKQMSTSNMQPPGSITLSH